MDRNKALGILGLSDHATEDEIKRAYRVNAFKYHPDKNKEAGAEEQFKNISNAYQFLSKGYSERDDFVEETDMQDFRSMFNAMFSDLDAKITENETHLNTLLEQLKNEYGEAVHDAWIEIKRSDISWINNSNDTWGKILYSASLDMHIQQVTHVLSMLCSHLHPADKTRFETLCQEDVFDLNQLLRNMEGSLFSVVKEDVSVLLSPNGLTILALCNQKGEDKEKILFPLRQADSGYLENPKIFKFLCDNKSSEDITQGETVSAECSRIINDGRHLMRHDRKALDLLAHIAFALTGLGLAIMIGHKVFKGTFFLTKTDSEKKLDVIEQKIRTSLEGPLA